MQKSQLFLVLLFFSKLVSADEISHCQKNEKILFNCVAGDKIVSVCSIGQVGENAGIEYRYGRKNVIEMKYAATPRSSNKFFISRQAVAPRAQIRQLRFERGSYQYLMTTCLGGECDASSGLIVYKNDKPISKKMCEFDPSGHGEFSLPDVDFDHDKSKNPLIEYEISDLDISPIYKTDNKSYQ
jgi:hypothetical protein